MALDPQKSSILYAGTRYGGVYKSIDGGSNWKRINNGLTVTSVQALIINPLDPAVLYAGTFDKGLFKTTNGGSSWNPSGNGISDMNIQSLAINPQNTSILYAGTRSNGVFKSSDSGASWQPTNNGLNINPDGQLDKIIHALVIDPQNPEIVYLGTYTNGLYKSTDGGMSWNPKNNGIGYPMIWALAMNPQSPETIYVSALNKVFKSTNGGTKWDIANRGIEGQQVSALAVDPLVTTTVYAGAINGLYVSKNSGGAWSYLMPREVNAIGLPPQSPATIYIGAYGGAVKSTDAGLSWNSINGGFDNTAINALAMDPQNPATLYAGMEYGIFKSTDGCAHWNYLTNKQILSLAVNSQNTTSVYAAALGAGVLRSTDSGAHWSTANSGLTTTDVYELAIDPTAPQRIYACTNSGVFKSDDGGSDWSAINSGLTSLNVRALAIHTRNPEILLTGTIDSGVFRSTNGGASWDSANNGLGSSTIYTLTLDPAVPQKIFAGTASGVFRSIDGGMLWSAANSGIESTPISSFMLDPLNRNTIYAGTYHDGVYKSVDDGASWELLNTGLANTQILSLAVSPLATQQFYAGTAGSGVWVHSLGISSLNLALANGGASTVSTDGDGFIKAGYAKVGVISEANPYGTAVFGLTRNGVTISEAGVPASPPTTSARLFVDYRAAVNAVPARSGMDTVDIDTGIAIVNPGSSKATVTYTLRNYEGTPIAAGHGIIEAGHHIACFIDYLKDVAAPDFALPGNFQFGTLEISSDELLSVLALRGTMNQRDEFLMTTTPVADLSRSLNSDSTYFPQFVDGGGYTTSLILMNTSDTTETGSFQIRDGNGDPFTVTQAGGSTASSFVYSIRPGGVYHFQTDGSPANAKAGWVRLTPDAGTSTPVGSGVFGFTPADVLVSESGIPSAAGTTHAHVYVDLSGNHNTGLAIANITGSDASITINAYQKDGITAAGTSKGPIPLSGNGYTAAFATSFVTGLPEGFTGVLDISSTTPFASLTLRSLDNERGEFLMTTFPVADATRAAPFPIIFPHIVDGGGYSTQFILISVNTAAIATLNSFDENGTLTVF
jgi:photosystem II stability/assembly factor-like uncharacterized protein